jgi:hypothetical protein
MDHRTTTSRTGSDAAEARAWLGRQLQWERRLAELHAESRPPSKVATDDRRYVWQLGPVVGGTSRAGLRSKKPTGESRNPVYSTGMTGQSSGRTK